MAALLVALSVMAVLMTVAMPTWRQLAQREKETELIFRGQQYARAVGLFQRKAGPGVLPPSVDALVNQHFLRKKYKDPITGGEFEYLTPTSAPVAPGPNTPGTGGARSGASSAPRQTTTPTGLSAPAAPTMTASGANSSSGNVAGRGGLVGVASKSKAESIRVYNGRNHYNEWQFVFVAQTNAPGQGGVNTANPGERGGGGRGGNQGNPSNPFGGSSGGPQRSGFGQGSGFGPGSGFGQGGGRSGAGSQQPLPGGPGSGSSGQRGGSFGQPPRRD